MKTPPNCLVGVAAQAGPYNNIRNALAALDLSSLAGKKVLIKPNAGRHVKACLGITVHPQAVAAAIDVFREANAGSIAIGESPILGVNTMKAFESTGVAEIARLKQIPLIDMDARKPVIRPVQNGRVLTSLKFCADIFDFDVIVSLAVTKSHMHTQVSLGIKNMKGCLWRHEKVRLHQLQYRNDLTFPEKTLDSAISDMTTLLLPHLTVIDGYIGMEGLGPSAGTQITSDFAVASFNPLAADKIAAELMGFDFDEIHHLRLIRDRKICSLEGLTVVPADYRKFSKQFRKSPTKIDIVFPDVVVHDKGSCSACLSTTLLFLKRFAAELGDYALRDGKLHVGIGKDIEDFPEGTILIGNCTSRHKKRGNFIKGCPPVASKIYKSITGSEPDTNEPDSNPGR
jgi:uncharacterized protein (DUF362 family)